MADQNLSQNIKYYTAYQVLFVVTVILLSSVGAFFHFLLDHEISIVESWLHNNHWEILIASKLLSLFLLNRWFRVRLYQLKTIRELIQELVRWPEPKAVVISAFMTAGFVASGNPEFVRQNLGYWYFHLASYLGLFLFFGIEFIVIAYLDDVLNQKHRPSKLTLSAVYTLAFAVAYRVSVPDYYGLLPYVVMCFASLVVLSERSFRSWSNVVCFLLLFVAPMGALFGLDPVWGSDFSPFKLGKEINLAFLAAIWVISFAYYKFRDQFLQTARKLVR